MISAVLSSGGGGNRTRVRERRSRLFVVSSLASLSRLSVGRLSGQSAGLDVVARYANASLFPIVRAGCRITGSAFPALPGRGLCPVALVLARQREPGSRARSAQHRGLRNHSHLVSPPGTGAVGRDPLRRNARFDHVETKTPPCATCVVPIGRRGSGTLIRQTGGWESGSPDITGVSCGRCSPGGSVFCLCRR